MELEEAVKDGDCIVLITDHTVFKQMNPQNISTLMRMHNVVDTRNALDHEKWKSAEFNIIIL